MIVGAGASADVHSNVAVMNVYNIKQKAANISLILFR